MSPIDLRSDTVTRPVPAMRDAMHRAELGDVVYGDDPTVNRLEKLAAEMVGMEAAIFVASGTQSNLIALLTHCQRGDEYIVGHDAHTFKYEGGGAAVFGSIQPQTVAFNSDAELPLDQVSAVIKPDDPHFARTRLLALENTQHGRVVSFEYLQAARDLCNERKLGLHLDGARVCNAAIASGRSIDSITRLFDSVSVCLSKGLGAPVGSVLCGSKGFIEQARRWHKVTGGGWRQAGMLAAAGIYSLEHMVDRLAEDHTNSALLADLMEDAVGASVRKKWTQTNMVWLDLEDSVDADQLVSLALARGLLVSANDRVCRLVVHHDVSEQNVRDAAAAIHECLRDPLVACK